MTDLATLRDLLARVKAATGPSRELDAAIYNAAPEKVGDEDFRAFRLPMEKWGDRFDDGWRIGWEGRQYPEELPRLTASIDAALALAERRGWTLDTMGQDEDGPLYAQLRRPDDGTWPIHKSLQEGLASFPLCILAAAIAAETEPPSLIEQEAS